jgi:FHS family L-fucose permease-like MFS transporter
MEKKQNSNVLAIGVMFLLFFMIAFVTNFAGSMGVIVKEQFEASPAMAQLGTLANFIAYACMGIPAGIILKRKGYKFTSSLAVTVGFVGVGIQFLSGYAESFGVYVLGAFVAGFSMCLLNIVVNPMLNTLGGGGNKGNQLIQLGGSLNSIGGTIAPILLGYLIGGQVETATVSDAAPAMIIAMAIFALAFVIIRLTNIPEPHMESAEERAARKAGNIAKDKYSPLSFRHFVLGAVAIFFYVGIEVGIPNIANLYMTTPTEQGAEETIATYELQQANPELLASLEAEDEANKETEDYVNKVVSEKAYNTAKDVADGKEKAGRGMSASTAGTLVGIYWFLMMVGRLIGGVIGGRVSSKAMLTTASGVAMLLVAAFIFIPQSAVINIPFINDAVPVGIAVLFLCGLCTSVMWGGIFNLAAEGLGKYTAAASGIFMALVCGGGVIPFLQGLLVDYTSYLGSYWLIFACLGFLLFYALVGSKNVNKDIPTE